MVILMTVITVFHQLLIKWGEGRKTISISSAITLVFSHIWSYLQNDESVMDPPSLHQLWIS